MKDEHKVQFISNIKHCYPDIANVSLHLTSYYTKFIHYLAILIANTT